MRGVIVLDGPDASGKTTLAKKILNGDDAGYIHLKYDPNWKNPDKTLWQLQYFALAEVAAWRFANDLMTVIDRHWLSEQIYARVYRGGSTMNGEARGWDRVLRRLCAVYVICAPEPNSAALRHLEMAKSRDEMYPADDKIFTVANCYHDLWHGTPFNHGSRDYFEQLSVTGLKRRFDAVHYDLDVHGGKMDEIIAEIYTRIAGLKCTQYSAALSRDQHNYLGHPRRADILFVGERINPNKSGRWPFIDFGASSRALSDVLNSLQFDETRALWTNIFAEDQHVGNLTDLYPHLKVIAFGSLASCELARRGIDHHTVFHPSYAKRFNQLYSLREQLRDLLS